jgi:hypothetical protein
MTDLDWSVCLTEWTLKIEKFRVNTDKYGMHEIDFVLIPSSPLDDLFPDLQLTASFADTGIEYGDSTSVSFLHSRKERKINILRDFDFLEMIDMRKEFSFQVADSETNNLGVHINDLPKIIRFERMKWTFTRKLHKQEKKQFRRFLQAYWKELDSIVYNYCDKSRKSECLWPDIVLGFLTIIKEDEESISSIFDATYFRMSRGREFDPASFILQEFVARCAGQSRL